MKQWLWGTWGTGCSRATRGFLKGTLQHFLLPPGTQSGTQPCPFPRRQLFLLYCFTLGQGETILGKLRPGKGNSLPKVVSELEMGLASFHSPAECWTQFLLPPLTLEVPRQLGSVGATVTAKSMHWSSRSWSSPAILSVLSQRHVWLSF